MEFSPQSAPVITPLPVPCVQPLKTLKGSLADIEQQLASLTPLADGTPVWLDIEVTQQEYLSDLQQRIETLTEGRPAEVLLLRRSRTGAARGIDRENNETLSELTAEEVFLRRLSREEALPEEEQQRLLKLFLQTLEQVRDTGTESE